MPDKHEERGAKLGNWLSNQRKLRKKGVMDAERERRLEEVGVTWDVLEAQWDKSFALLVEYREREGDCDVPDRHEERGENLGKWLGRQRKARTKGAMDAEKERRLEEAGVTWDPLDAQWEKNFALLVEYREREGDCDVPRKHEERGVNLGKWLSRQREARNKGAMDAEKERRLEEAGVRWRIKS